MLVTNEPDFEHAWWFNLRTGTVEFGLVSPGYDRAGPFATRAEAEAALERVRENNARWDAEDD